MSKMDLRNSVGVRLVIVAMMSIFLLIPSFMIVSLINERQERRDQVANEISSNWGERQVLIGPVLSIPYKYQYYNEQKVIFNDVGYAHFLPEDLDITGAVKPSILHRGIYEIVVYNCKLDVSALFKKPHFNDMNISPDSILWDDATLSFGISDMKGVKDQVSFDWNGKVTEVNPGTPSYDLYKSGISIPVNITDGAEEYKFKTNLNLNGSFSLLFSPIGKETSVHLNSTWRNPSFTGDYLPIDRDLNQDGFKADWKVLQVSRDFPQKWTGARYKVDKSLFGVNLLLPVDQYQKTMRTVKYAIMFIGLTFLTFFIIEILSSKPIHPIQYLLIGLALMVFYTLLLSISEYVSFGYAYLIACFGIIALITIYSTSFLVNKLKSAIVALVLIILYGYLYIVLQLQDYALLMGSLILFIALALMMFLTRKIDWFSVMNYKKIDDQPPPPL